MLINVNSIKVKKRIRKDMGDLEELKNSMKTFGLMNPITLNSKHELVAGARRLQAAKDLGWININAVIMHNLTDVRQMELEIEENNQRKPFTDEELLEGYKRLERVRNPNIFIKLFKFIAVLFEKIGIFFKNIFSRSSKE